MYLYPNSQQHSKIVWLAEGSVSVEAEAQHLHSSPERMLAPGVLVCPNIFGVPGLFSRQHKLADVRTCPHGASEEGWLLCLLLAFTDIQMPLHAWQKPVCAPATEQ